VTPRPSSAGDLTSIPRFNKLSALSDLRSLGWLAPVRVAYELSKAAGGHRLVFGSLARQRLPELVAASPFQAPPIQEIPAPTRERCLREAAEVCSGKVRLFGEVVSLEQPPDWHSVVHDPGRWPLVPWWKIDVRTSARPGDVKWAWELGRGRHLVVLARAARLQPDQRGWVSTLTSHLTSWIEANPPEMGVHWYSNLEISLRALNWLQVLSLVGDQLDLTLRTEMSRVLYLSGRHLVADLPYTLSSMRNNHLLGDALGLCALGRSFPGDRRARRWSVLGCRIFRAQLLRHMRSDGSMIEDSVSYHRFVLEMLALRVLLGGPMDNERDALAAAARFMCRIGALAGPVPLYGDWDEGKALVSSGDPMDLAGSTRLALSVAGSGSPDDWRADHDEVSWYSRPGSPLTPPDAESDGRDAGGGITRVSVGPFTSWLKAGSGPSHGHADLCSTAVAFRGHWLVGDPGTGSYNRTRSERDYFRTSIAHSVLRIDGQDQLVPQSAFRWRHRAYGKVGEPIRVAEGTVAWGYHDAYRRLNPPRRVCRAVLCYEDGVSVADWVEGPPGCAFELSFPLGPGVDWQATAIRMSDGTGLIAKLPGDPRVVRGGAESVQGSWSPTYGKLIPATLLITAGAVHGPIVWQLSVADQIAFRVDGDSVVTPSGARLSVAWSHPHPSLRLDLDS
jgi:hypothetical protein